MNVLFVWIRIHVVLVIQALSCHRTLKEFGGSYSIRVTAVEDLTVPIFIDLKSIWKRQFFDICMYSQKGLEHNLLKLYHYDFMLAYALHICSFAFLQHCYEGSSSLKQVRVMMSSYAFMTSCVGNVLTLYRKVKIVIFSNFEWF